MEEFKTKIKKIFISQPMRGLTDAEIKKARMEAQQLIYEYEISTGYTGVFAFIDPFVKEGKTDTRTEREERLWYLGQSIQALVMRTRFISLMDGRKLVVAV